MPPYNAGMVLKRMGVSSLVLLALVMVTVPWARAQTATGFTADWRTVPAVVGQANAILVASTESVDLARLSVSVVYGDQESVLAAALQSDGRLSAEYTPPVAGAYKLHLTGSVNGRTVDEQVLLSDVQEATLGLPAIQVDAPEPSPDTPSAEPNWTVIGGGILAAVLLIAAVLVGRLKR